MEHGVKAALACAALGLSVIPVKRETKKSLIKWGNHQKKKATDADIKSWWRSWPEANIGIVTGRLSGIFVLDVDSDVGAETISKLQQKHGPLPRTWRVSTGRGEHIWFKYPEGIDGLTISAGAIGPGLDTRGEGGYVVAPGSVHGNGAEYLWQDDCMPEQVELADVPDWLLDLLKKAPPPKSEAKINGHATFDRQFDTLRRIFEEERNELAKLVKGNRNTALNMAAFALGQLSHYAAWTESEARSSLEAACQANGLYYDAESGGAKAVEASFTSGWQAGVLEPRDLKPREIDADRRRDRTMRQVEPSSYKPPESEIPEQDWARRIDLTTLYTIPPRQWLYGVKLIRGFTTFLASPGGVGKTALTFAAACSCASGVQLLHDKPHSALNVWLYNLEDPYDELRRRLAAVLMHYNGELDHGAIEQRLFINSGRDRGLLIAERQDDDLIVTCPDAEKLILELLKMRIDLLIIDPFIMTHQVNENSNSEIEKVVREFNRIADQANCAVLLVHHSRKGFVSGDADSIRGGSAIIGAARAAYTLSPMQPEEARALSVPEDERRFLIRIDDAKANMAPRESKAQWVRLVSQNIGNGDDEYPHGDNVQVATKWDAPENAAGITIELAQIILNHIDAGIDGERYSPSRQAERSAHKLICSVMADHGEPKEEEWASKLLAQWEKNGVIYRQDYESPGQRRARKGLFLDRSKMPRHSHA